MEQKQTAQAIQMETMKLALSSQDTRIASQDTRIASQDATIAEQNTRIASQDATIAEQNTRIASQDATIAAQSGVLEQKQSMLTDMDALKLKNRQQQIAEDASFFATIRVLRYDLQAATVKNENLLARVSNLEQHVHNLQAQYDTLQLAFSAVDGENVFLRSVCNRWFRIMRDVHTELGSRWTTRESRE
jgi:chromosome segregation ATPase